MVYYILYIMFLYHKQFTYYMVYIMYYLLHIIHYMLYIIYFLLHIIYLYIIYYILWLYYVIILFNYILCIYNSGHDARLAYFCLGMFEDLDILCSQRRLEGRTWHTLQKFSFPKLILENKTLFAPVFGSRIFLFLPWTPPVLATGRYLIELVENPECLL